MTDRYSHPAGQLWERRRTLDRWSAVWFLTYQHSVDHIAAPDPWLSDVSTMRSWHHRAGELEAVYGHDVAAAAEALREALRDIGSTDAARWLHYGLCSSDVADAAQVLAMREATALIRAEVTRVLTALDGVTALSLSDSVYRTHGQAAQIGLASERWHGLSEALGRADTALGSAAAKLVMPAFGGPTGTGGVLSPEARRRLVRSLGDRELRENRGRQNVDRAEWVRWTHAVARLAGWCESLGTQVRLLAQTGIGEVTEGRGSEYRGSSSMPHKRNPTQSERLCGLAPVVRGLANGYAEAAASNWDAHSLEHSSAERVVLPQVAGLTAWMLSQSAALVANLQFSVDQIEANAAASPADSYAERNRRVLEGEDGGSAYTAVHAKRPSPGGS